jgi:outer membrane protein TolC
MNFTLGVVLATGLSVLCSCVPSSRAVRQPIDSALRTRLGTDVQLWANDQSSAQIASSTATLLLKPLDVQSAISLALRNNRHLQNAMIALGIPAGQLAQATTPRATDVDMLYRRELSNRSNEFEITITQDLIELITTSSRRTAANLELQAAQQRATAMAIETAGAAEISWYRLVAEQELLQLRQSVAELAASSFEFTSAQHAAGNVPDLTLLREQDNKAQADLDVAKSTVEVALRRSQLAMVLGITVVATWTVTAHLPALPDAATAAASIQQDKVVAQSLEQASLKLEVSAAEQRSRLASIRSWVPEFGAGVSVSRRSTPGASADWDLGPALRLALPLFNWNQGGRAVARAELAQAQHASDSHRLQLVADFRVATQRQQATYQQALQIKDTILPLRQKIVSEVLLHYNAMNATPFELLLARRAQADANQQYIELLRDFWISNSVVVTMQRGGMSGVSTNAMGE